MISLIFIGLVGLVITIALVIIISKNPDLWFWVFLNLFFDPGGYVMEFLGGTLIGPLYITDACIVGIVMCMIFAKINWNSIFQDKFLLKIIYFLILFAAYYYIFYGGIVPYINNDFNYSTFLIKNRTFSYGFIILIAVYAFSLRSLKYFYITTLFIGVICLSLYVITLSTGIKLVPMWEMARYTSSGMTRIGMSSYGLFYLIFPFALTTYLLRTKIYVKLKYTHLLYYGGIIMIITQLLTLARRTQIDTIGTLVIIIFIISYLFRTGKLSQIFKIVIPVIVVVLVLFFTFPKYVGYIATIGEDTILLMTTGKDSKGEGDYRVSGNDDLLITKNYIWNNLLLGNGYTHLYWGTKGYASSPRGDRFAIAADAAFEVPIYNLLFGFGIVGAILIIPLYYLMANLFFKLIKTLKFNLINYLHDPITVVFSIYILWTIARKFTLSLYQLSIDFTGENLSGTAIIIGIGFALYRKLVIDHLFFMESKSINVI